MLALLAILALCAGCETQEQRLAWDTRMAAEMAKSCGQTLTYVRLKNNKGWCLAGCTDGWEPMAHHYVLAMPCPTSENGE